MIEADVVVIPMELYFSLVSTTDHKAAVNSTTIAYFRSSFLSLRRELASSEDCMARYTLNVTLEGLKCSSYSNNDIRLFYVKQSKR